jgi:hypothetical protein
MDAVISGRVGKALLLEGDSLRSFDVDDPGTLVSMVASDYQLLFGDAPDLQFLEDTDAAAFARALEFEHNCACALDVALISLDPELSTELRAEAVGALEELIRDERVLTRLEYILYAEPLPPAADLRGALEQCEASRAATVRTTFEILEHHQQAIREVKLAWDAIPLRTFEDEENHEQFKHLAVHEGLFRSLVLARGSQPQITHFRADSLRNPSVRKMQHSREVLGQWIAPYLLKNDPPAPEPYVADNISGHLFSNLGIGLLSISIFIAYIGLMVILTKWGVLKHKSNDQKDETTPIIQQSPTNQKDKTIPKSLR